MRARRAQGRATVEMEIKLKEARQEGVSGGTLKIVVDGYNAPVTGGNFVDLVQRGFYNNMEIQRADGFVVQTGDPGPPVRPRLAPLSSQQHVLVVQKSVLPHSGENAQGEHLGAKRSAVVTEPDKFLTNTQLYFSVLTCSQGGAQDNGYAEGGKVRRIPFEVMVRGDKAPVYEETLEDLGRFNDQPALPFNAYGTMALARGEFEANSGSSQVFWLLKARPPLPPLFATRILRACCKLQPGLRPRRARPLSAHSPNSAPSRQLALSSTSVACHDKRLYTTGQPSSVAGRLPATGVTTF